MTTTWDRYVKKELRKPAVKKAYEEETKALKIGLERQISDSVKADRDHAGSQQE